MNPPSIFRKVPAAVFLVAALSGQGSVSAAPPEGPPSGQVLSAAEMEDVLFHRLNVERRERGLKILLRNPVLDDAARRQAADMAARRTASHVSSERRK